MAEQKKTKSKKSHNIKKVIILSIVGVLLLAAVIFVVPKAVTVYRLYTEAKYLSDSCNANTFKNSKTTIIYDTYGEQLCTMKNSKDLYYVDLIPDTLANAFVVMEDRNFYDHSGVDYKAIMRAIVVNQQSNDIAQGASTITQQLARNTFLTQEVTWQRKVEEIFISWRLEKKFSKKQILEFYLNNIYFGNGYYGVEAAAKGYFSKTVSELTLSEQAFIAAIPNNPTKYNPITNYDNTVSRRNLILNQLRDAEMIGYLDCYSAQEEEIVLNPEQAEEINSSVVTYARHCATESLMSVSGFSFRYNFESQSDNDAYEQSYDTYYTMCQQKLLSGGYTIYTSIDMNVQNQLQQAVDDQLAGYTALEDNGVYAMQGAAACVDNNTGNVVAIVGSRTQPEITGFTLNRAYQSYRQSGSSIKPLNVYLPYLQLGNTPDTIVNDEYTEGGPANSDGTYAGSITLREAVRTSKNTVAWKLYEGITPRAGSVFLMKLGYKNIWMDKDNLSSSLGGFSYGVTAEEMAGAYATIANEGIYRRPTCVISITDVSGKKIIDESNRGVRIYEINACRMMTDMLKTVVESGTGVGGAVDNAIIAGKTGTTNSNKDSWYCGYSRYYTTTVWMGYDYPKAIERQVTPAIFHQFMQSIHTGLARADFTPYNLNNRATAAETTSAAAETTEAAATVPEETSGAITAPATQPTTGRQSVTQPTPAPNNGSNNNAAAQATTQAATQRTTASQIDFDSPTRTDADAGDIRGEW